MTEFEPHDDIHSSPGRDEQVRRILIRHAAKHRRRRWWLIAPVSALVLVGLTAGTIALLLPVTDQDTVSCVSRPELAPDGTFPGTSVAYSPTGDSAEQVRDALDACSQVWGSGLLDPTDPDGVHRDSSGRRAPGSALVLPEPSTVCVMRDGTAAVVPGDDDICSTLGLARKLP